MKALIVTGLMALATAAFAQTPGGVRVQSLAAGAACKNAKGAFLTPALSPPPAPFDAKSASLGRIKISVEGKDCFLEAKDFSTGTGSLACSQVNSVQPFDTIGGTRGLPEAPQPRCDKP